MRRSCLTSTALSRMIDGTRYLARQRASINPLKLSPTIATGACSIRAKAFLSKRQTRTRSIRFRLFNSYHSFTTEVFEASFGILSAIGHIEEESHGVHSVDSFPASMWSHGRRYIGLPGTSGRVKRRPVNYRCILIGNGVQKRFSYAIFNQYHLMGKRSR